MQASLGFLQSSVPHCRQYGLSVRSGALTVAVYVVDSYQVNGPVVATVEPVLMAHPRCEQLP